MAILSTVTVDWRQTPRLITVAAPVVSVSVQDIYDTMRSLEDDPLNMSYAQIISAGGKEPLSAGQAVGITASLLNAIIKFEDRGSQTVCSILGGNLVAFDAAGSQIDPVAFSTNVLVYIAQASSSTINDVSLTARLQHLLAGQDETHSPYGEVYYWDPVNGDDANDALLPITPRQTFKSIHDDLCTGYTRDTIIFLARDPSGLTLVNERIVITKNHVLLSGPGRAACIAGADDLGDTITIDGAYGVEIDSVRFNTGPGPTARNAITVKNGASHVKLSNLYIDIEDAGTENVTGTAISIVGGNHHIIDNIFIQGANGDGIHLEDSHASRIERCKIFKCGDVGIHISSSTPGDTDHVTLNDNVVQHSITYDIEIGTNVLNTAVRFLNDITDSSSILDNGMNTQWERKNQALVSAFYNWEEFGGDHLTPGTAGFNAAAMAYMGSIHIDTTNGTPGVIVGTNGTIGSPVSNLADAIILAAAVQLRSYVIRGVITLTTAHDDWTFNGLGTETVIQINGQDIDGAFVVGCELSGDAVASKLHCHDCTLDGITNFSGIFSQCRLRNSISLSPGSTMFAHSVSYVPGAGGTPILDVQGAGRTFQLRSYSGGIEIQNMTDPGNAGTIELLAGQVIVGASNTAGDLAVRGTGVCGGAGGGVTIDSNSLLNNLRERFSRLDEMVFNANKMMTSARERVFPSKALADAATDDAVVNEGEIETYDMTAVESATPGLPTSFSRVLR